MEYAYSGGSVSLDSIGDWEAIGRLSLAGKFNSGCIIIENAVRAGGSWDRGLKIEGLGLRVWGPGFRVPGLGSWV